MTNNNVGIVKEMIRQKEEEEAALQDSWNRHFANYDLFMSLDWRYEETLKVHQQYLLEAKKILDSGAGSGNLTEPLIRRGKTVTAVDFNKYALNLLKDKCLGKNKGLTAVLADVQNFSPTQEYDAVNSMFVVPFVPNSLRYFCRMYNALKLGGRLILTGWAPEEDTYHRVIEELERRLRNAPIWPVIKERWGTFAETSKERATAVLQQGPSREQIAILLDDIGFKDVDNIPNAYGRFAYTYVCKK